MDHVFNDDFPDDDSSRRSRASKINLIPFNCNDVFRDENKEMEEEKGEKRNDSRGEKREERGMELSAFGREQLGGKRERDETLGAGSREGGLESVKKIC